MLCLVGRNNYVRIGKLPVTLPAGVEVKVSDNIVTVKAQSELQEQISTELK